MAMKRRLTVAALGAVFPAALLAGCYMVAGPRGVGIGISPFVAAPRMAYISDTQIQVVSAPGVAGDVFYYSGAYWRCHNGLWYRSSMWNGGWMGVGSVPRVFLSIPLGHRMHHVVRHHPLYVSPVGVPRVTAPVVEGPAKTPTVSERFAAPVRKSVRRSAGEPTRKPAKKPVKKSGKGKGRKK